MRAVSISNTKPENGDFGSLRPRTSASLTRSVTLSLNPDTKRGTTRWRGAHPLKTKLLFQCPIPTGCLTSRSPHAIVPCMPDFSASSTRSVAPDDLTLPPSRPHLARTMPDVGRLLKRAKDNAERTGCGHGPLIIHLRLPLPHGGGLEH